MGEHKVAVISWCLIIQFVVSLFCGNLLTGLTSGGIPMNSTLPSSPWSALTDGIGFWWQATTFQINGMGLLSVFFLFLNILELWCFIELIRGD
jgi:hypothetical protein